MKAPVSTKRAACKCPRQERATVRIKARDTNTVIEVVVVEQALVKEALLVKDALAEVDQNITIKVLVGMMCTMSILGNPVGPTNKGD